MHRITSVTLLCFISSSLVFALNNLYFSPQPNPSPNVIEGEDLVFKCGVNNHQSIHFTWLQSDDLYSNPIPISNTSKHYQNGTSLILRQVNRSDSVFFWCVARNVSSDQRTMSNPSKPVIKWLGSAKVIRIPNRSTLLLEDITQPISIGEQLTLKCNVTGRDKPTVIWYRNHLERIFDDSAFEIRSDSMALNSTLIIDRISIDSNGVYTCAAFNAATRGEQRLSGNEYRVNVDDGSHPHVDQPLQNQLVLQFSNVTLSLPITTEPIAGVVWYQNRKRIPNDPNRRQTFPNGSLLIMNFTKKDEGIYLYRLSNSVGLSSIYAVYLSMAYIRSFSDNSVVLHNFRWENPTKTQVVAAGERMMLKCDAPQSQPPATVHWIDQDLNYYKADQVYRERIQLYHSGKYTCLAENVAGRVLYNVTVVVTVPPLITSSPKDSFAEEGESVYFECVFDGNDEPFTEVHWWRKSMDGGNGLKRLFTQKQQISKLSENSKKSELQLPKLAISDAGYYMCEIITQLQEPLMSRAAKLIIQKKLKFLSAKSEILQVSEGEWFEMQCKADASLPISFNWCFNQCKDVISSALKLRVDTHETHLSTSAAKKSLQGVYTCTASTSNKRVIRRSITLIVITTPVMMIKPRDAEAEEGSSVMFHCLARSDEYTRVIWYLDDADLQMIRVNIDSDRFSQFPNGSLMIEQLLLQDNGFVISCTIYWSIKFIHEKSSTSDENLLESSNYRLSNGGFGVIDKPSSPYEMQQLISNPSNPAPFKHAPLFGGESRSSSQSGSHQTPAISHKSATGMNDLRLDQKLGAGKFGDVIAGIDGSRDGLPIVMKQLHHKSLSDEFKTECNLMAAASKRCESIQRLIFYGTYQSVICGIFEFSNVECAKDFLTKNAAMMTAELKFRWCNQLAAALQVLHKMHFTHFDVAARNLIIESPRSLNIKLTRLSLCFDNEAYSRDYQIHHGNIISARWNAPEFISSLEPLKEDKSCDVWSYSITALEIWSPLLILYEEQNDSDLINAALAGDFKAQRITSDVPEQLRKMFGQCLKIVPSQRPTLNDIAHLLKKFNTF